MGLVNSAWTMHFVSCAVNPCDVTIHMRWKKKKRKKNLKREVQNVIQTLN